VESDGGKTTIPGEAEVKREGPEKRLMKKEYLRRKESNPPPLSTEEERGTGGPGGHTPPKESVNENAQRITSTSPR